jgi:cell cycle checkpoint protein
LSQPSKHSPSKEFLDLVVESANGDIRSAVMALQFACVVRLPADRQGKSKATKGAGSGSAKVILEAITRREQSLALFHLMGKVLYNKR